MKKYILFVLVWWGGSYVKAQDTVLLNKRYILDYLSSVLISIEVTDTQFYAMGSMYDTSAQTPLAGVFFITLDTFGNVVHHKRFKGVGQSYDIWDPTLRFYGNNGFVSCGYFIDDSVTNNGNSVMQAILFRHQRNGDTLWTKKYVIDTSDAFLRPTELCVSRKGEVVMGLTRRKYNEQYGRVVLMGVDSLGNYAWDKEYINPPHYNSTPKMEVWGENSFILSYMSNRAHFHRIDSVGNILWNHYSPIDTLHGSALDILITQDSGIVFGTSLFRAIPTEPAYGYVFKYKEGQGRVWSRLLGTDPSNDLSGIRRLVELPNGNIVAAGVGWDVNRLSETIWINLLSANGDSLWSKIYFPVGADTVQGYGRHHVYDMELTPSGYLLLCGETYDAAYAPEPRQQGWLLKLKIPKDASEILSAQTPINNQPQSLRIYPNPATDYAVVDFKSDVDGYSLQIHTLSGQIVENIAMLPVNGAFILDVSAWAAGCYSASVFRGTQRIESSTFLVRH